MRVLIKERACTYKSDYPEGWKFSSGDYFKFPVNIKADLPSEATYTCFIKRFEKKDPASITGWDLLVKLEHKNELNLTRVYDIASVEENGKRVYYVFYEFLQGNTLDYIIARNVPVDLARLTNDLFHAFASLRKYGYWFADFVEKNIFVEDNGRFVLMDLDSAQPNAKLPHDDMYGSKDYWVLVFAFYSKILNYKDLKVDDLSGLSLNHLQIVFLILRLKISFDTGLQRFKHAETFNELPEELDKTDPSFKNLFSKVYSQRTHPQYEAQEEEIKQHIIEKVIPYEPKPVHEIPAIEEFTATPDTVEKGEPFELRWKVSNATAVELYKNGAFDARFTPQEKGITKTAFYDGRTKTISYRLIAFKGTEQVESIPVDVRFKEKNGPVVLPVPKIPPVKEPQPDETVQPAKEIKLTEVQPVPVVQPGTQKENGQESPEKKQVKKINRVMRAIGAGVAALVLLGIVLLIKWWPSRLSSEPAIVNLNPKYIFNQHEPVTIYGKNFPVDSTPVQVLLNNVPGAIQSRSADSLVVIYPPDADPSHWRGSVTVGVVINKDTLYSRQKVFVLRNLADPNKDETGDGGTVVSEENDLSNNNSPAITDTGKRRRDSIALWKSLQQRRDELEKTNRAKNNKN